MNNMNRDTEQASQFCIKFKHSDAHADKHYDETAEIEDNVIAKPTNLKTMSTSTFINQPVAISVNGKDSESIGDTDIGRTI